MLIRWIKRALNIHLIRFESYVRTALIVVGAFASYSLGANNIANVMGVFAPAFNLQDIDLRIISLSSNQQLFLLGSLAIAVGILTYSKRVMETVGSNIVELSAEAALVVVLAESLVLFIFSSSGLSNLSVRLGLPPIPLAPVSSSQVVVGCVIGIGLYKGARNINFKVLREIGLGWISTPLMSGLLAFFMLFFMKNIFNIDVGHKISEAEALSGHIMDSGGQNFSGIIKYLLIGTVAAGIIAMIYYYLLERKKNREISRKEEKFWKYLK
jgi:PiT family inorganic phosphate transporter